MYSSIGCKYINVSKLQPLTHLKKSPIYTRDLILEVTYSSVPVYKAPISSRRRLTVDRLGTRNDLEIIAKMLQFS